MTWLISLSLLVTFELIADIFSKEYSLKYHWYFWVGAILAYIIANIFWLSAIRNGSGLARGATLFSVASAVVAIFLGIVIYKEEVSLTQVSGMLLGVIAVALVLSGE